MSGELSHEVKIALARAVAISKAPYFSSVIYGFVFVPSPGIGTMFCTAKMILGYDPEWAEEATVDELAADVVHEVHHFMRRHFERFDALLVSSNLLDADLVDLSIRSSDGARLNLAGDLAINPDLRNGGWKLADENSARPAIYPKHYNFPEGLTTEEYYALLRQQEEEEKEKKKKNEPKEEEPEEEEKDPPPQLPGVPQAGVGEGDQGPPGPPPPPPPPPGQKPDVGKNTGGASGGGSQPGEGKGPQPGSGQGKPRKGVGQGHCGGIAGSPSHPELEKQLDGTPDLGRDAGEMKHIEKRVANDIKDHVEKHGRGDLPAGLVDWIAAFDEEGHVRWQDELAHVIRDATGRLQAGGDDFSLRRPSKRSIMRGFLRPGLVEHLPEVAIIRDTSGSMGAKQLTDATRESFYIMQALGIDEVWFTDADTEVAMPWKRVGGQFFKTLTEVHGRGGTDFRPGIESAMKLLPGPDIIVYVTDGDGTTTKMPPPGAAVVWCIVPSHYNQAPAPWGHTVIVSDDPKKRRAGATAAKEDT